MSTSQAEFGPPARVGIVGCGTISRIYLQNAKLLPAIEIVALADLLPERAASRAEEFGVPRALSVDALLDDPEVEIVLNLTIPNAHFEVAERALLAGKSVYNEKPLTIERAQGQRLLALAAEKGLRVGGAPDTFLGAGIQTCRQLIDEGAIGKPVAAVAFMLGHGHESWHPDPAFYYHVGGGPMFDMGPYYLTALVNLIGPIRRITGSAQITFPERTITSQPKYGETIKVETPTHIAGVMDFASGAVGTIVTSFDVWPSDLPRIEIFGTDGTLSVPDPNGFGGPVQLRRPRERGWHDVALTHANDGNCRGLGVADLAGAIRADRPQRASGELTYHVLDAMHAFLDASAEGRHVDLQSTCERPAPLPPGLPDWVVPA